MLPKRIVDGWDPIEQRRIGLLVESVPSFSYESPDIPASEAVTTMQDFFRIYPELAPVDFIGDGHSCQFIAVGQAACSSPIVAGKLRKLAVKAIGDKWSELGAVVMSEISDQSGIPLEHLDQQVCLEQLSGSATRKPLWGNHCTLAQLPAIVQKNIVVLTSSNGKPFKLVFDLEGCCNSVYIGFLPEFHYFAVTPREVTSKSCAPGHQGEKFKCDLLLGP